MPGPSLEFAKSGLGRDAVKAGMVKDDHKLRELGNELSLAEEEHGLLEREMHLIQKPLR
ncbi:uncharacterized protein ACHE_30115A [Aspergillus chevalieri]|uniref:Uncharacterized protein n=1 Tax=Aspergillus chevalieri TaxID=182096 RepID=A0A7R7VK13_ASPCH|nr:uncharacterized protein ACHE_30115A [Aspergillus chevalieri]BCR86128.1 hypothetical protein ACHE_30115A [Aspergillus chevalieri]